MLYVTSFGFVFFEAKFEKLVPSISKKVYTVTYEKLHNIRYESEKGGIILWQKCTKSETEQRTEETNYISSILNKINSIVNQINLLSLRILIESALLQRMFYIVHMSCRLEVDISGNYRNS